MASIINDAPIEEYVPGSNTVWRPQNSNLKFYGPTRFRFGLVHSRNTVSIRILQAIGVPYAIDYASKFGFDPADMPRNLTLALGTNSVTPMQLASGLPPLLMVATVSNLTSLNTSPMTTTMSFIKLINLR